MSQNIENKNQSSGWELDSIVFDKRIHINNDTLKEGMAVSISLQYPKSAPAGVNLEMIQQTFAQTFTGDTKFKGTPQQAFGKVREELKDEATELGDGWLSAVKEFGSSFPSFSDYEHSKRMQVDTIYNNLLTLSSSYYSYTGGAHGYGATLFYNIDAKNGQVVNDTILFGLNNLDKVSKLIQAEVKRRNSKEDSEETIGLLVEIEEVIANNNFYFTKNGIAYLYNQYEIASYAQGQVEIVIPYQKILPLVSEPYRKTIGEIANQ